MAHRIVGFATGILFVLGSAGYAAAEYDDECVEARVITDTTAVFSAWVGVATEAPSDPPHSCNGGSQDFGTVWFTYTSTYDGTFDIRATPTNGTDELVLSAYTGSCGALTEIACVADGPGTSSTTIPVVTGETYYFEVSKVVAGSGDAVFAFAGEPENDHCALANEIPHALMSGAGGDFGRATEDLSDPPHFCTGGPDFQTIWYSYTPTENGSLQISATGSFELTPGGPLFYTYVLSLFTGACESLSEIGCLIPTGPPVSPATTSATISVNAGETYYFEISSPTAVLPGLMGPSVSISTFFTPAECGDASVNQPSEECDDGNEIETDACTSGCLDAECGDGFTREDVEQCDDGNVLDGDGCQSDCTTVCGDGLEVGTEQCDDGNAVDDDACDNLCRAPCPYNLCKCLGAAGKFAAVSGSQIQLKSASDFGDPIGTEIYGSACASIGKLVSRGIENVVEGDLILSAPAGKFATKFPALRIDDMVDAGTYVLNDFATGGALVKNQEYLALDGVVSLDGTHPRVAECNQAMADLVAASALLASQPPTQTVSEIVVEEGDVLTLNVGSGLQVINVGKLKVLSGSEFGEPVPSVLDIVFASDTDAVIINVLEELRVDADGFISVDGLIDRVVLNLPSPTAKVKLKLGAYLDPTLLVPSRGVKVPLYGALSNVYTTGKLQFSGASAEDVLLCQ